MFIPGRSRSNVPFVRLDFLLGIIYADISACILGKDLSLARSARRSFLIPAGSFTMKKPCIWVKGLMGVRNAAKASRSKDT